MSQRAENGIIYAPFTEDEVEALRFWQDSQLTPEFTCRNRHDEHHTEYRGNLRPTVNGWICLACDFTQDWAYASMIDRDPVGRVHPEHRVIVSNLKTFFDDLEVPGGF